jgi:diguanylate cyclase
MDATATTPSRPAVRRPDAHHSVMRRWIERKWVLWAYLAVNTPLVVAILLVGESEALVLRSTIPVLTVAALVVGLRWQRPADATAWWLITGAAASVAFGYTLSALSRVLLTAPPPEWVGPAASSLALPLLVAGLAFLGRHGGRRETADMLDATVIALAVYLVLFALVIGPVLPSGSGAILGGVLFPLGALLLFAMAVWVALSRGVRSTSVGLLMLAVCLAVVISVTLVVLGLNTGTLWGHVPAQLLYGVFAILLGCAALHPSLGRQPEPRVRRHGTVSSRRIKLLAGLAIVAPLAWGAGAARTTFVVTAGVAVPVLVAAVMLVLLVARLGVTAGVAQRRAAELGRRSQELAAAVEVQETLQRQLRHQALRDPLTGLANRVVLAERMGWALSRPGRHQHSLAAIDLDHFREVNDGFGHVTGDQLLIDVSHRLLATMPAGGTLARVGGDEFAALLEDTSGAEASAWAERVRVSLRRPYRIAENDLYLSASVGLVTTEPAAPVPTPSEALRDADLALAAAKAAGRDRVELFRPELRTARTGYRRLRTGLQRALARDEMTLHYQPIVDLADGRVVAVESLLRWAPAGRHPLPPSRFIPVAEDGGLIRPIGAWAMQRACRDAKPWYDDRGVAVTVNVSPRQLDQPDFADLVIDALETTGLPGQALILEITETSLVATSAGGGAMNQLHRLRPYGVRVAMDDFGTGYSSLANVARLPIDLVKIDRSFIQDPRSSGNGSQSWAFTRAVLNLVDALGLPAVAEGVETLEQAEALRRLRCPLAQGYLFARPMPPDVFGRALSHSYLQPENGHRWPTSPRAAVA